MLNKSPWEWFSDFYERVTPTGDELWVTNGRINELWQSAFDDLRKPYIHQRWPDTHVEIHSDDARPRGIESGDDVIMESDDILVQTGGFHPVEGDGFLFSKLDEKGLIRRGRGSCRAVAIVTDDVRPGVLFTNFLWAPGWPDTESNSLVHGSPTPSPTATASSWGRAGSVNSASRPTRTPSRPCPSSPELSSSLLASDRTIAKSLQSFVLRFSIVGRSRAAGPGAPRTGATANGNWATGPKPDVFPGGGARGW